MPAHTDIHDRHIARKEKMAERAKTETTYLDMTPTWEEMASLFFQLIYRGDATGRKTALNEIRRMGRLADMATIILGGHRRPDAPAIPEADAIKARLDAFAAIKIWGPFEAARFPLDVLDADDEHADDCPWHDGFPCHCRD